MVANCPIMWQSKLQSETALSIMEAEIVALAHSCRKLFLIMDGVGIMGRAIGFPVCNNTIQVLIHEDNAGALVLDKTLSPQFTSRSKHYHAKTIWFQEEIKKHGIKLLKTSTTEQLKDFTPKDYLNQSLNISERG